MSRKVEMYSPITEEAGVVMVFSQIHEDLGFPKLMPSSARGFDIADIEYKGNRVTVEFEYTSDNFIIHDHPLKMDDNRNYVLICYEDNCNILKVLREQYKKTNIELIEVKKYVEIKQEIINDDTSVIEYIVLNYNPSNAGDIGIQEWKKTNMYGINAKFANDTIVKGSQILFKQGNYIVAACEVINYVNFDEFKTNNERKLYSSLINYPIGLWNESIDDMDKPFAKGYIFYDNFVTFDERRVKFDDALPAKQMGLQGMLKITKEEYYKLLGN